MRVTSLLAFGYEVLPSLNKGFTYLLKARSLGGTFESNCKMADSESEHSISTILREKGDCEQSINIIIDCN